MKIFDATTVIAFLSEMDCPEGIVLLSKHQVLDQIRSLDGQKMSRNLSYP